MEIDEEVQSGVHSGRLDIKALRAHCYQQTHDIDVISQPISYQEFFLKYLLPNKPCVLEDWATEGWRSRQEWVTENDTPNLRFLADNFGSAEVPVADCDAEQYSSHPKNNMLMREYIDYLMQRKIYCEGNKHAGNETSKKCLYLKDWHFTRAFPNYEAYQVPVYFCSDWLNESWDLQEDLCDDYRFVYIGPKGSWTPFHTDVFKSYSWSANIVGCKKWILFPPGEEQHYKDRLGNLVFDLQSEQLQDRVLYPHMAGSRPGLQVMQTSGQEDTVSINHNWYNGCNIDLCWAHVKSCLGDVQREIADCRDMEGWHQQCQLVLKASCGMDCKDFLHFLQLIANRRISRLDIVDKDQEKFDSDICDITSDKDNKGVPKCFVYMKDCVPSSPYYDSYNKHHALFDLDRVFKVMEDFMNIPELLEIDLTGSEQPRDFLNRIRQEQSKFSSR